MRHVGVSNVNEEQLTRLCAVEKPACLQIEVHALCQQNSMIAAAQKLGIPVVAYSPLGSKALADALAAKTGYGFINRLVARQGKRKRRGRQTFWSTQPVESLLVFLGTQIRGVW